MGIDGDGTEWLIDLEISLVKTFGWSLFEIDNTDIESLLPFIRRLVRTKGEVKKPERMMYADECDWL